MSEEEEKQIACIGNLFLKYLELRYGKKKDKLQKRTIEQVLMSELKFTFEQTSYIESLIAKKKKDSWTGMAKSVISFWVGSCHWSFRVN